MTLGQCLHLPHLLHSTDRAAFLNYEQIIIHICPHLVKWNGSSRLYLQSCKMSYSTSPGFIFTTMKTFNLLLIISNSVLWITWCKKCVKSQLGTFTFVYFMVCMVYMKYLLHFLNYSCFLLIIINVASLGNTDFNRSCQRLIHSIPFFNAISHERGLYKISGCCKFCLYYKTIVGVDISDVLRKHT